MGYLGREWDQSVFGSWARDIGGQTSSRRISGDPITTSTSAAWFTPNIRHRHDLWPDRSKRKRRRRPWNIGTWRTFKTAIQLFRTVLWIKDIEFLTGQEFIFYSVCFKVKVFTLTISLARCSCPVLWKYIPHFHFCVRVQSPCLGVLTFLSVSVFSWLSGVRGRECLVTREIASRNIWQYLNNNKASANLNMKSLFSLSVSGHVPLISEIVSEKSGASCFYLGDRTGVDSQGKEAKIDFSC